MSDREMKRIAIVEDHAVTAKGLSVELASHAGIEVVGCANDFQSGLRLVRESQPDIVLLDLHLPDCKGPRTLIKTFRQATDALIIIFSGEDREIVIETALDSGADAFLHKTATTDELLNAVRNARRNTTESPKQTSNLSASEKHILSLLARGYKYGQIAQARVTSIPTVKKQCEQLVEKLGLTSREELIAWAAENGFGYAGQERADTDRGD